jgi:hypothetical protein
MWHSAVDHLQAKSRIIRFLWGEAQFDSRARLDEHHAWGVNGPANAVIGNALRSQLRFRGV